MERRKISAFAAVQGRESKNFPRVADSAIIQHPGAHSDARATREMGRMLAKAF
ncbi:MAG TPA: hypothetical protein VF666_11735 [Pyrinomonadaceae bacterium]|jgi:hypothetical protein